MRAAFKRPTKLKQITVMQIVAHAVVSQTKIRRTSDGSACRQRSTRLRPSAERTRSVRTRTAWSLLLPQAHAVPSPAQLLRNVHGEIIHVGVADLELDHRIVLELKANVKDISEDHKAQLMRYLRAANQDARRGYVLCDLCLAPCMHFRYCMAQCQDPYYLFKFSMFLRFSTRRKSFLLKI